MEAFKRNFVSCCKEHGVVPSSPLLCTLKATKTPREHTPPSLDFSGCNLSVQDCAVLAKTLSNDINIEEVRFTDCLLTEDSCKLLLNAFASNKCLKKLDFKGNNIRSSAEIMGRILKLTTTLTHLNLEWNGIGLWDTAMSSLADGLQANQTLRFLDLRNNQITHEGGTHIANALKINRVLKVLDLRWNSVGMLGAKSFISMLRQNKEIIKLELSGNNIPSDMLKAIESSIQRNAELQATCKEQKALTASYKQKLEAIESERNMQITSLVGKLTTEKEMYSTTMKSAQDKIENLKMALDERKSAFLALQEKFSATENSLRLSEQSQKIQEEYIESLKQEQARKEKDLELTVEKLREQLASSEKINIDALQMKKDEVSVLEKKVRELEIELVGANSENEDVKKLLKERELKGSKLLMETEQRYNEEMENLKAEQNNRRQVDLQKQKRMEDAQLTLEDEVSQLKSKLLTEKLKFEEEMLNMKMLAKQEEMSRSRQFEERIEVLQASRNEFQTKATRQSSEISDLQSRLTSGEREVDSLKRQCESLKQQIESKEEEMRDGNNKLRLEIDKERRTNSELRDKIAELERALVEQERKARDEIASKEMEIATLKNQVRSKDDEIARNKNDELKRTEMLENALQSYIASAKKAR